jgi:fluoroacetyl-CoA thioesterase
MELEPGATNTIVIVVDESMTADRFGNTGVQVLATPMLVSYFELAAHQLAMPALEPGQGTVGSHIDIRHLAATPIGMRVTFRATLTERNGRRLLFRVEADDEHELVGEGTHERFVVDMHRFMERIATKGR